jgi:macrodomain Ter protein organizer (MatP/YcbG family)
MPEKNTHKLTRMSIDISMQDHRRLKVLAAAAGITLKEFVIDCIHERINPEKKPNAKTRKAMGDARRGKTMKAKNMSDLYEQLEI